MVWDCSPLVRYFQRVFTIVGERKVYRVGTETVCASFDVPGRVSNSGAESAEARGLPQGRNREVVADPKGGKNQR